MTCHNTSDQLSDHYTRLLDDLVQDVRIIGWSEGIHLRHEYLAVRNAVIRYLVQHHRLRVIAAETHSGLARHADAYITGSGADLPSDTAIRAVWSWAPVALRDNLRLLLWLRAHNSCVESRDRVRFYGLDMYGFGDDGPAPDLDVILEYVRARNVRFRHRKLAAAVERWSLGQRSGDRHYGVTSELITGLSDLADCLDSIPPDRHGDDHDLLQLIVCHLQRLAAHQNSGGDHRDLAVRDGAQFRSLQTIAARHPADKILVFEQVEHLDPDIDTSLGHQIAAGALGPAVMVGALWSADDVSVSYPIGRYRRLSRWLDDHSHVGLQGPAGTRLVDLETVQLPPAIRSINRFRLAVHAPRLSPALGVPAHRQAP